MKPHKVTNKQRWENKKTRTNITRTAGDVENTEHSNRNINKYIENTKTQQTHTHTQLGKAQKTQHNIFLKKTHKVTNKSLGQKKQKN